MRFPRCENAILVDPFEYQGLWRGGGGGGYVHCYAGDHSSKEVSSTKYAVLHYEFEGFDECLWVVVLEFLLCCFVAEILQDYC